MNEPMNGKLAAALVELDEQQVAALVSEQLATDASPLAIVDELRAGMNEIGQRFADGTYFLTELVMAAEIFARVMQEIEPRLGGETGGEAGEVVIATVQGDVHDIGKNIVAAMLRGADFRVHDLGVDVPPEAIVSKLQETGAGILGLSALLTISFDSMKNIVGAVQQAGLRDRVKIMIGGGPVDDRVCSFVGADAFGRDAQEAVNLARQFMAVEV